VHILFLLQLLFMLDDDAEAFVRVNAGELYFLRLAKAEAAEVLADGEAL
jgi:hypothetical protein